MSYIGTLDNDVLLELHFDLLNHDEDLYTLDWVIHNTDNLREEVKEELLVRGFVLVG
ncbi:hypothetical protein UT300012_21850 [Paraclostridium bifermentans]